MGERETFTGKVFWHLLNFDLGEHVAYAEKQLSKKEAWQGECRQSKERQFSDIVGCS